MNIANDQLRTYAMDHHGLVASICKDLKILEKIDARIDKKDSRRIVSTGMAVVAMIINGLGFTNRRLYLTPQFFESKPAIADSLFRSETGIPNLSLRYP